MGFFEKMGKRRLAKKNLNELANVNCFIDIARSAKNFKEANRLLKNNLVELKFLCQDNFEMFLEQIEKVN